MLWIMLLLCLCKIDVMFQLHVDDVDDVDDDDVTSTPSCK
jgi:hypothetical protein